MKKLFNFAYVMNFMSQTAFSFAFPFAIWLGIGYLLTNKVGLDRWVMAVCIVMGVLTGVLSMFKYIITAVNYISKDEESIKDRIEKVENKNEEKSGDS